MMTTGLFLSFFLGIGITTAVSSLIKTEFDNMSSYHHSYSIPSVETIVDSRFKLLGADFQDQLNDLKGQVATLKGSKAIDLGVMTPQHQHEIHKRQTNTSKPRRPVCEDSSSLCTFFHPDHPDAGRKKVNHQGMPTNCSDLQLLGHKLNGLYLVKSSRPNQGTKIETIFCNFQSQVSQEMVGNVDIKTKIVHFYVQRNTTFSTIGVIPFQLDRLNEGGAMNLNTGTFTAPVPGIYHFEFCGVKHHSDYLAVIKLQINGEVVAIAKANPQRTVSEDSLSLTASFRLRKGDNVNLFHVEGTLIDDESHYTQFAGWLVEEDLI